MKHNDNNLNPAPEIPPELEARIVAWVAGEASAFEAAELERLTSERPELAAFKARMAATTAVVLEALQPDPEPLRMSAERRAKLLATFGDPVPKSDSASAPAVHPRWGLTQRAWWRTQRVIGAAACFVLIGFIAATLVPSFVTVRDERAMELFREERQAVRSLELPAAPELQPAMPEASVLDAPGESDAAGGRMFGHAIVPARPAPVTAPRPAVSFGRDGRPAAGDADKRRVSERADPPVVLDQFVVAENRDSFALAAASPVPQSGAAMRSMPDPAIGTSGILADALRNAVESNAALPKPAGHAAGPMDSGARDRESVSWGQAVLAGAELKLKREADGLFAGGVATASDQPAKKSSFDVSLGGTRQSSDVTLGSTDDAAARNRLFDAAPSTAGFNLSTPGSESREGGTITLSAFTVQSPAPSAPVATTLPAEPPYRLDAFTVSNEGKNDGRVRVALSGAKEKEGSKAPAVSLPLSGAETAAATAPVSTFSLHVSDVSFRLVQGVLAAAVRGENIEEPKVRAEEIYNALDYGDPFPSEREKVVARVEQSAHPVLQQRNLVRIALRVAATGRAANRPLQLTVLLDTSGSMEREDRRAAVRRAMAELVALLGPQDRVTLIGFARQPRLLAENVAGDHAGELAALAADTPPDGGTNLEEALKLARDVAVRHRRSEAQNRIVLLTDGAANLGDAQPARLAALVEELRERGVAFDACGVGLEGAGDTVLEALTRRGDGRYYVLDRPEVADAGFARKLAGALRPAAENVKVQVRFNPARVGAYRLIGFEQHRLREEDFRNDKVDAAELAAEEAAVAMYQIEPLPQGTGDLGEVFVRFRDPATGDMVERSWPIAYDPRAAAFDRSSASMQLAGVATMIAEKLTDSGVGQQVQLKELAPVVNRLRGHFPNQARVEELVTMFNQLRRFEQP